MDRLLSDEEINTLLALFQGGDTSPGSELPSPDSPDLVEHKSQRRFYRLQQRLAAVLYLDGTSHQVFALNISLGGVFICCPMDLPIDRHLELDLDLPQPRVRIKVSGEVCWSKKLPDKMIGVGIRFSSLTTEAIWAILANIEEARKKAR